MATEPLELLHIDFLKLEVCKGKYEDVLVVVDHFTKYSQAYPCKNQEAKTVARVLWENFIRHYGFPQKIITDQGANFEGALFRDLCAMADIHKVRTTSYHPQTNGVVERFNSTLMNMLGCMSEEQKGDWKQHLFTMCHAYNATPHSTTGYSPFYLLFGRHPRLAIDWEWGLHRKGCRTVSKSKYLQKLHHRIKCAYKQAQAHANKEADRHKRIYDRKCRAVQLHPGDLVLVKVVAFKGRHKIQNRWESGEYVVLQQPDPIIPVYVVKPAEGGKQRVLHRNLLLPIGARVDSSGAEYPEPSWYLDEQETESPSEVVPEGSRIVPLVEVDATSNGEPAIQLPEDPESSRMLNLLKSVEVSVNLGDISVPIPNLELEEEEEVVGWKLEDVQSANRGVETEMISKMNTSTDSVSIFVPENLVDIRDPSSKYVDGNTSGHVVDAGPGESTGARSLEPGICGSDPLPSCGLDPLVSDDHTPPLAVARPRRGPKPVDRLQVGWGVQLEQSEAAPHTPDQEACLDESTTMVSQQSFLASLDSDPDQSFCVGEGAEYEEREICSHSSFLFQPP